MALISVASRAVRPAPFVSIQSLSFSPYKLSFQPFDMMYDAAALELKMGRWRSSRVSTSGSRIGIVHDTDYDVGDCLIPAVMVSLIDARKNGAQLTPAALDEVRGVSRL
jgi:hypothetical protein